MNTRDKIKQNETPAATTKDTPDDQLGRWGRDRHKGFPVGKFVQPAPMFFTQDHHPLWLGDIYRGRAAFLICGGPSFKEVDKKKLAKPGILTMGMNNSPRSFRPNLWVSVDSPDHFIKSIWLDPTIQKFVPICHSRKKLFDNDKWEWTDTKVGDCPNMVYYKRNERFNAAQFLREDCMNWGNHSKHGGGRSVMLAAVKMLYLLGVRTVFLLGADFNMAADSGYHFDQGRHKGAVKGNTETYEKLNERFTELRPYFEKEDFYLYNCNPDSNLKSFEFISYDDSIVHCLDEFDNINVRRERTEGMYEGGKESKKPPKK